MTGGGSALRWFRPRRDDGDGRDDDLGGEKDRHHRHGPSRTKFRRGAGCPFQRAALLGEATAVAGGKAP